MYSFLVPLHKTVGCASSVPPWPVILSGVPFFSYALKGCEALGEIGRRIHMIEVDLLLGEPNFRIKVMGPLLCV